MTPTIWTHAKQPGHNRFCETCRRQMGIADVLLVTVEQMANLTTASVCDYCREAY